ncbi:dihydrolipoyl dehydrogenase [Longirhabdus pacifica]|uniref:dihydrolipoyl dehydrogenase n=1 Tax=Longirhabdus pacifica TaxID=2305227 RepID=UPI001008F83D|nr:dihydrolipoyl dehydrogenase [Longirhabdus pacifica]
MVVGDFTTDVDLIVIGAGPGGYVAAIRAAQLGKSVVIVDKGRMGGVCLNVGCIPSKALISAAHRYEIMKDSEDIGITAEKVDLDFSKVQAWKDGVVNKLTGNVGTLLKGNDIQIVQGEAFFTDKNVVSVSNDEEAHRFKFNDCIIATGSRPIELRAFPYSDNIISSTGALNLKELPKSMIVIGGGYIGIELGQTYAKFGTEVTVLEGADNILPGFPKDMSRFVLRKMKKLGATVHTSALAQTFKETDEGVELTFEVKGKEQKVTAEYVLVTVGRRANTDDIGLENIGVDMDDRGLIKIDNQCRSSVPNIYAIGDVVEGFALAHKASYEGKIAAEAIAGHNSVIDYKAIPAVVFSDPEMASVGLSEDEAKEQGYEVVVSKFNYAANGRALAMNATDGFVKIVSDKATGVVLGGHIVGEEASNLIAEFGLAIETATTVEDIALTIHAHPSLGEIVMETAEIAVGNPIHQLKL